MSFKYIFTHTTRISSQSKLIDLTFGILFWGKKYAEYQYDIGLKYFCIYLKAQLVHTVTQSLIDFSDRDIYAPKID